MRRSEQTSTMKLRCRVTYATLSNVTGSYSVAHMAPETKFRLVHAGLTKGVRARLTAGDHAPDVVLNPLRNSALALASRKAGPDC